jgi:hypothetical protein
MDMRTHDQAPPSFRAVRARTVFGRALSRNFRARCGPLSQLNCRCAGTTIWCCADVQLKWIGEAARVVAFD